MFRRKMQGSLHGGSDRTAGSEDRTSFAFTSGGQKLREAAINACKKSLPGFDAFDSQSSFDPHRDNCFEEFLKIAAALRRAVGGSHGGIEFTNVGIRVDQMGEAFFEHDVTLKLIKFRKHDGLGKTLAVVSVSCADSFFRVAMADAWAGAYAVESNFVASPVFAQNTRLGFARGRKFVVVWLKKRSLCVANQKNASHASPEKLRFS